MQVSDLDPNFGLLLSPVRLPDYELVPKDQTLSGMLYVEPYDLEWFASALRPVLEHGECGGSKDCIIALAAVRQVLLWKAFLTSRDPTPSKTCRSPHLIRPFLSVLNEWRDRGADAVQVAAVDSEIWGKDWEPAELVQFNARRLASSPAISGGCATT